MHLGDFFEPLYFSAKEESVQTAVFNLLKKKKILSITQKYFVMFVYSINLIILISIVVYLS